MGEMKNLIEDFQETMKMLKKEKREATGNFQTFMDSVLEEGDLDTKTKELVTLGTAITARCKYCIGLHTKKALEAGATKDEILEVALVSMMMGGGPALTYVTEVRKALEEFE